MTPFAGTNRVTSPFGPRISPITKKTEHHNGQDIVTTGDWTVRECTGGVVLRVTSDKWRGNYVDVQTAPGVFERYQHMARIYVKAGDRVPQGTPLGIAGSTGDSTGVHLHFEVQKNGAAVNPSPWSGIPNVIGSYPGNNNIDGKTQDPDPIVPVPSKMVTLQIGPMSSGDKSTIESLAAPAIEKAKELGLPVKFV